MKLRTFKYHLGQSMKGMFKNGFMSLAAIATVAAYSFILILSLCICLNIDYMLEQIEKTIGITVFLGSDVTDEMAEEIGESIRAIDHVTEVVYKSADDNLDDAMSTWENPSILEGLRDDNPIPASYEISLDGAKYQADVVATLKMLRVSVETELNSTAAAEEEDDGIERIYLDENGNEITRKQAEELGIVEPETTEGETAAETQTAAQAQAETSAPEAATETVTSGAQADLEAEGENAEASVTEAQTAAAQTEAQTAAEAATAEAENEIIEPTTQPATVSQELLDTMNSAVAATAGGNVQIDGSGYSSSENDGGVAGTDQYDASQYGIGEYEYKGIEKIRHATEEASYLVQINTAVRIFSLIVVAILCVISIAIIMNTIRLTVVIRKNEINIMKYVGATDWFIRWPFVIEGMLIGFIGSVIPTLLCFFGYTECIHLIGEKWPFIVNIVEFKSVMDIFIYVAPVTIIFGMLLGIIGSASSMRKYLRV